MLRTFWRLNPLVATIVLLRLESAVFLLVITLKKSLNTREFFRFRSTAFAKQMIHLVRLLSW